MSARLGISALLVAGLALAGCTAQGERVERPVGLAEAGAMQPAAGERGAWTYLDPAVDLASYRRFILEPPVVYGGEGASFGGLPEAERYEIAQMFVDETRAALTPIRALASEPGAGTARLRFTLIGVEETVPYVSTVTRVIPVGAALNVLKAGTVGGGTLTGSVTYGVEVIDSLSGKVVAAAIRELTPGAFDLSATLGTRETARAVAKEAAAKIRARIEAGTTRQG